MSYSPPAYNAANIEFASGSSYSVPAYNAANIEFVIVDVFPTQTLCFFIET